VLGRGRRRINVAHQLGGFLGPGIPVTVFAAASTAAATPAQALAYRVGVALTAGSVMLRPG
jgi:hypothetical protein